MPHEEEIWGGDKEACLDTAAPLSRGPDSQTTAFSSESHAFAFFNVFLHVCICPNELQCKRQFIFFFLIFLRRNDNGLKTRHGFLFPHLLSPLLSPCVLRSPSSSDLWLSVLLLVCIMSSASPCSIFSSRSPWSPRPGWHKDKMFSVIIWWSRTGRYLKTRCDETS